MNKPAVLGAISLAAVGLSNGAVAADAWTSDAGPWTPWYVGLGVARNESTIPQQTIDGIDALFSAALGSTATVVNRNDRSTGLKFLLGYGFNRYLAVEGGLVTFGKTSAEFDFRSGLNSAGTARIEYKTEAIFADVVGTLPLGEKWALLARGGASFGRTRINFEGNPLTLVTSNNDREETKVRPKFGAGVQYEITSSWTARAEWERYQLPDPFSDDLIKIDSFTASVLYHF